jgi:hypothetical protein
MSRNRSLGTLGVVLLVVAFVIVLSVPGAWAVDQYKTLHRFKGRKDEVVLITVYFGPERAGGHHSLTPVRRIGRFPNSLAERGSLTPN